MVCQQKPIVIDPASIAAVGALKAAQKGRPKKGVVLPDAGISKTYRLSEQALAAIGEAAASLGISENAVVEGIARALSGQFARL